MVVTDFIQKTIEELKENGHRDIQFLSASDCKLVKNGIKESYLIHNTDLNRTCFEINLSEIEDGLEIDGSKLRIFSIPKRKRKGLTLDYYIGLSRKHI